MGKFLSSKFSGYLAIALLLAMAGGAYYIYSQGKMLGGAKEKIEAYKVTIAQQEAANLRLIEESNAKQAALSDQTKRIAALRRNAHLQQLAVMEARKHANKVTRECMALHLDDGLQFGPSRKSADGEDKAGPSVDG